MARQRNVKFAIVEGHWYGNHSKPSMRPRWVLRKGVTHVIYSDGGDGVHKECLVETFARWARKNQCISLDGMPPIDFVLGSADTTKSTSGDTTT